MKNKSIFFFVFLGMLFSSSSSLHEYYLSTTVVRYVQEKSEIQLVAKLFVEDVQDYLNQDREIPYKLDPDNLPKEIEKAIEMFFQNQFHLKVNKKKHTIQYLGKSYDEDLIVLFGYITLEGELNEIVFDNRFLLDFLPSQQNIVHFKSPQQNKSFLAKKGETRFQISF